MGMFIQLTFFRQQKRNHKAQFKTNRIDKRQLKTLTVYLLLYKLYEIKLYENKNSFDYRQDLLRRMY